ncbi:hypothetical protein CLW00_11825 [Mongoliibacter ruber]|uniref:Uncharacterized protein n=1 Tax=Mongoliibacter ruber TaxID=1750599 RepID=A0A2T0WD68_9BACT|nr:hypothetical protein CLW00_11825 [Mongoliibacter ruber]
MKKIKKLFMVFSNREKPNLTVIGVENVRISRKQFELDLT